MIIAPLELGYFDARGWFVPADNVTLIDDDGTGDVVVKRKGFGVFTQIVVNDGVAEVWQDLRRID